MTSLLLFAAPSVAGTDPVAALWSAMDHLIDAADLASGGDLPGAGAAVDVAIGLLDEAATVYASPAKDVDPAKVAKAIAGARKKLVTLRGLMEIPLWSETSGVKKLATAGKSLQKLANMAGRPVIAEVDARSAGFHGPGDLVPLAFAIPAGCTDWQVQVTESVPGVVAIHSVDAATGAILVTLGSTRGSARVSVTGCGIPPPGVGRLIYNYGAKPVAGVPAGFPQSLPSGNYGLSYWMNVSCTGGGGYSLPETSAGTFPLSGNLKAFYQQFKTIMDAAVSGVSQPGCTVSAPAYSSFDGSFFTCTLVVSCTSCTPDGCATCTSTVTFKVKKL